MTIKKRIVIVGATSAIAEHCARLWVQKEAIHLTLIARDSQKIQAIATDLHIRNTQCQIEPVIADFYDPVSIQKTVDQIARDGSLDIILIAHGFLPNQENCQTDLTHCDQALQINAISPVLYAEAFAQHLAKSNQGTLAIIGSVAGDRGRKSNYVYGAAKGLIKHYAQGLQHRFAGTGVQVILINPGPTDTPMTAQLKTTGIPLASVESVAKQIVTAIQRGTPIAYVPKQWYFIMSIIKLLPGFIFNRLNI